MSYSSRVYRQRNPRANEESKEESFFSKQHDTKKGARKTGFFQAKLAVNEPGDSHEKEADSVAQAVVNKSGEGPVVQNKKIGSIQRLSTPADDEKLATNDARMKKDKDIQEKAIQQKGMEPEKEKKEVQKKDEPKKEEEKGTVQKKEGPEKEKEVMKKDEPKKEEEKGTVQKKEGPEKEKEVMKKDEPKKEEEKKTTAVQAKSEANSSTASSKVSAGIEQSAGKGEALPAATLHEMNAGFGVDFSKVRIHNDQEAVHMNSELEAQAFTHGTDIYFNEGKFSPTNSEGKFLLAHELTHVVQQKGSELNSPIRRQPAPAQPPLQQPANITTPVPADGQALPNGNVETAINGVRVLILTDAHSRQRGRRARTTFRQTGGRISNVRLARGRVTGFDGPTQLNVRIQTIYQRQARRADPSGYGRGTTAADQASGDISLGFHEGHHGIDFMDFLGANPIPEFTGQIGMTKREFNRARRIYNLALRNYFRDMGRQSLADTDCVGTTMDQATGSHQCIP